MYSGQKDKKIEAKIRNFVRLWGGSFQVEYVEDWQEIITKWKRAGGEIIHLTMYGLLLQRIITDIRKSTKDKMIVVGGAKVPKKMYDLVDLNVAITSQPHSEIGALAVFLHELFQGKELSKKFQGAQIQISPQARGKKVIKT
jgi:tRNA (cytidine56-2'-O)-methyltransferase